VHQFVECVNCEGKLLVREVDLPSHTRQHHEDSSEPPALSGPAGSPLAGNSSAAKRPKAEVHSPAESACAVEADILGLTEGEFAIPDKYSRDPLGRIWRFPFDRNTSKFKASLTELPLQCSGSEIINDGSGSSN